MSDQTPTDLTLHILREIQAELVALRVEMRVDLPERILEQLRREHRESREQMLSIFGAAHRDHDRRINRLEVHVDDLERRDPERRR